MSDTVLRAIGLGKKYVIGGERQRYRTLREAVSQAAMRPLERIRHPGAATHASEELWALRDIDFEVERGEVLGIIGRNGAGKSTLLKILSRITEPTQGRVEIRGRVGSLLEVGTGFHSELTGRENIHLNGAILGMSRADIKSKFDEIVEFSEIGRFLDTPVKRYSSGMYVRLAFAVAAHLEPDILIVDEVLAVGDAEFQRKCLGKMGDVAAGGRTVLFVSHNMGAVNRLCQTGLLLEDGKVKARGPVQDITSLYLQNGGSSPFEREWPDGSGAPGDTVARLRRLRVVQDGAAAGSVDIRRPVDIEMEYDCLREGHLLPIFSFFDDQGQCLFVTADFARDRLQDVTQTGLRRCVCRVPGNLFAEGTFRVLVEVSTSHPTYEIHFLERDAVSFQVVDYGEPGSVRAGWGRPLFGSLRPACIWEYESVGGE
ncbi:MAG: ABC transporter ATP-binding protein [Actinobacteria bacterium HGW-Actinobacteria-10]|nr:MAG: ABC transporter ATP-binding protein [Actinobacteria bacterium HGW-Actinobacteria-10]